MAKNIDFMGAIFPDVPSVKLPQQGGGLVSFDDTTDATATADKILQGYTAYANGQKLVGTASGGITPSGTIQITQNGTVDVTQYASADVNVSGGGGSSNVVQGTFHTESAYAKQNISIPYSGNGYPIGALIYPKDGPSGTSAFVSSTRQYAFFFYSIIKSYVNQAPTYGTSNTDENKAWVTLQYKRSSSGIDMTTAGTRLAQVYTTTEVTPSTGGAAVRFRDNKTMQVMVHANSYGFLTDMDYEYIIIYSE